MQEQDQGRPGGRRGGGEGARRKPGRGSRDRIPLVLSACGVLAWIATATITQIPTITCKVGFESAIRMKIPATTPGAAQQRMRTTSPRWTSDGRLSASMIRRFRAVPSASRIVIASAGSATAKTAGPATSAKPKPIADWSVAPAVTPTATRMTSSGSIS